MYSFTAMSDVDAREIVMWRYPEPYTLYNLPDDDLEEHIDWLLKPEYHYYSVRNEMGELIAFRCFGEDAQVPGGDYSQPALDMGGGLRPDLSGKGLGASLMNAAFDFAKTEFNPERFRATVAGFNLRALKVCKKVGYRETQRFVQPKSGREFVVLVRGVSLMDESIS